MTLNLGNDTYLVEELRSRWVAADGAGIAASLKLLLRFDSDSELDVAAHALVNYLDRDDSASAPSGKRQRTSNDAPQRPSQHELVLDCAEGEPDIRVSADFIRILSLPKYAGIQCIEFKDGVCENLKPSKAACEALGDLQQLRKVAMPSLRPPPDRWDHFARALRRVEEAWFCSEASYRLVTISEHMVSLVRLRIDLHIYGFRNLLGLRSFPCLRHLFLRGRGESFIRGGFRKWAYGSTGMLDDDRIVCILSKAPVLQALDISFNLQLTRVSADHLVQKSTLRTLRWQHPPAEVAHALGEHLPLSPSFQRLDLSYLSQSPNNLRVDVQPVISAMPGIDVACEIKSSSKELATFVPQNWPIEECRW